MPYKTVIVNSTKFVLMGNLMITPEPGPAEVGKRNIFQNPVKSSGGIHERYREASGLSANKMMGPKKR